LTPLNDSSFDGDELEGDTVSVDGENVVLGSVIDSGGEGWVYHVERSQSGRVTDSDVVKVFKPGGRADKEPKIKAMIAKDPTDRTFDEKGTRSIIWPEQIVRERPSGSFLGYTMPYVDVDSRPDAFEHADRVLSEENSTFHERIKTALNLAIMVYNIHKAGHAIGDFNDKNILVDEDCHITLIDCDGFHITGEDGTVYPESVELPRYAPPEGRGETVSEVKEADRFSLGVHIFQFLMGSEHPYQAERGEDAINGTLKQKTDGNPFPYGETEKDVAPAKWKQQRYDQFPQKLKDLFERCFPDVDSDIPLKISNSNRPTTREWIDTIGEISKVSISDSKGGGGTTGGASGDGSGGTGVSSPVRWGTSGGGESGIESGSGGPTDGGTGTGETGATSPFGDGTDADADATENGTGTGEDDGDEDLKSPFGDRGGTDAASEAGGNGDSGSAATGEEESTGELDSSVFSDDGGGEDDAS
jgi:hypothetical protein